jgi:hypothetical protein
VELIAPNETFWGVDLQLNKTIVELESLEKALNGEGIDRRLVREYRDAMDSIISIHGYVAAPANFRSAQLGRRGAVCLSSHKPDSTGRTVCLNVVADLHAGYIRQDSAAVEELAGTVEQLQQTPQAAQQVCLEPHRHRASSVTGSVSLVRPMSCSVRTG